MAIRYREGRARPWEVYWNNPFTGRRQSVSFKTEQEAKKENSLLLHRLHYEREFFKEDTPEDTANRNESVDACFILFMRERQFEQIRAVNVICHVKPLLRHCVGKSISEVTEEDVQRIQEEISAGRKNATINAMMQTIESFLKWCSEKGYCSEIRFPKRMKKTFEHFVPPTTEEINRMLKHAAPHIARIILIASQCGARVGQCELLRLTWEDVDFDNRTIRIHGAKKNPKCPWRLVPLGDRMLETLRTWKAEDEATLKDFTQQHTIVHFRGEPVRYINVAWHAALKRAGITRRIRPYDLRHAFATELIAAGVDVGTVAQLMGHSSPVMTLTFYQHVLDSQKRQAIDALPKLEMWQTPCVQNAATL